MSHRILPLATTMPFGEAEHTVFPTLLWDERDVILVDCGAIGSLPLIEQKLLLHGLTADQVTGVVLTHHDHDHMGAAAALKRKNPNVIIYASHVEAPFISGHKTSLKLLRLQ